MARATTSRSQRPPRPSQSQTQGSSQSQRTRRGQVADSEAEDEDGEVVNMEIDDDNDDREGGGESDLKRKANDLVRLAIFTEHKRMPLRREDITKKVLAGNSRVFNQVLQDAQKILRETFGMELVELQSRAGMERDAENLGNNEEDLDEARRATGVKRKSTTAGSKTYILRSTLDPNIIERAALTDEQILEEEALDAPSDDDDDEDNAPATYGSIIAWSSADQLGGLGVLYVVLALILVHGRVISDLDLRSNLKRLNLTSTSLLQFTPQSTHRTVTLDQHLNNLIRMGYIDRQQVGESKQAGRGGGKRARPTQADEEAGTTFEWRWGTRAQSEVGEKAIAKFVAEFMVGGDEGESGEEEEEGAAPAAAAAAGRGGRARGGGGGGGNGQRKPNARDQLEKMTKGIETAAGGNLQDLK